MHSPLAHALRVLDRYCIVLVHTLKHLLHRYSETASIIVHVRIQYRIARNIGGN